MRATTPPTPLIIRQKYISKNNAIFLFFSWAYRISLEVRNKKIALFFPDHWYFFCVHYLKRPNIFLYSIGPLLTGLFFKWFESSHHTLPVHLTLLLFMTSIILASSYKLINSSFVLISKSLSFFFGSKMFLAIFLILVYFSDCPHLVHV